MTSVVRLLTFVDLGARDDDGRDGQRMSLSARHEAVLDDGRRVVLLEDRGWTSELRASWSGDPSAEAPRPVELPSIWASVTQEELESTARDVVGPDEPFDDLTPAHMEATHWDFLANVLREHGVDIDATALRALRHDVELADRVRERLASTRRPTTGTDA